MVACTKIQAGNVVKDLFVVFSAASSMSLLPWQGEKVADRPGEGFFASLSKRRAVRPESTECDAIPSKK